MCAIWKCAVWKCEVTSLVAVVMCANSCAGVDRRKPVPTITVLVDKTREVVSVELRDASRSVHNPISGQTKIVFPAISHALARDIGGRQYTGLSAEGDGDRIEVLASRRPDAGGAITVISESSFSFSLNVVFQGEAKPNDGPARDTTIQVDVAPGKCTVDITEGGAKRG
jgi:hypothetical protein